MKNLKIGMFFLLGFVASCASTKINDVKPLTSNLPSIKSEEELRLFDRSNRLHRSFVGQGLLIKELTANNYLNTIANKLVPKFSHDTIKLKFFILKNASVNAFALPNGNIYINAGLIAKLSSESQLAYVIAHEISHVIERHSLKALIDRKNTVITSHVADLLLFGTGLIYFVTAAELASFSREMEYSADLNGIRNLVNTDYDPYESIESLKRLQEVKYDEESWSPWNSHPETEKRIQRNTDFLATLSLPKTINSDDEQYEKFRKPLAKKVINMRMRNKQFELAENIIDQELLTSPNDALLYFYKAEVNRLKATEIDAYAREYSWLHDENNNKKLKQRLVEQQSKHFTLAKQNYDKSTQLNQNLGLANRGLGLLALFQGHAEKAKHLLSKYLKKKKIPDRRYITSIIKNI